VAERIVEREQAIEGDRRPLRQVSEQLPVSKQGSSANWKAAWLGLAVFVAGMFAGAVLMVVWALYGYLPRP
jgi:hypothetical protein